VASEDGDDYLANLPVPSRPGSKTYRRQDIEVPSAAQVRRGRSQRQAVASEDGDDYLANLPVPAARPPPKQPPLPATFEPHHVRVRRASVFAAPTNVLARGKNRRGTVRVDAVSVLPIPLTLSVPSSMQVVREPPPWFNMQEDGAVVKGKYVYRLDGEVITREMSCHRRASDFTKRFGKIVRWVCTLVGKDIYQESLTRLLATHGIVEQPSNRYVLRGKYKEDPDIPLFVVDCHTGTF
jgi:hypothetical protein